MIRRHHLSRTAADVVEAVEDTVAFHSSDPATPHLAAWARVPDFEPAMLEGALVDDRALWRLHAMRRTLFVVPSERRRVFEAGAGRHIARRERRRLIGWLEPQVADPAAWLEQLTTDLVAVLAGVEMRTQEITAELPELSRRVRVGSGKWSSETPVSSRILFLLAMEGKLVRTRAAGTWRSSQYHWTSAETWHDPRPPLDETEAQALLLGWYVKRFGPVSLVDMQWWTGWNLGVTKAALATIGTSSVETGDGVGYVMMGDEEPEPLPQRQSATLLPGLDPTPMGWKERDWFLGGHQGELFDRNGNIGPTVWIDGRIVGGWAQDRNGTVLWRPLEDLTAAETGAVQAEAERLTLWCDGTVVTPRFRTPLEKRLAALP